MKEQQNYFPYLFVYFFCMIFSMLGFLSLDTVSFAFSFPMIDIVAIFYFGVYRKVISIWLIFFMGLAVDSMSGSYLGVTSLSYILIVRLFQLVEIKAVSSEEFLYFLGRFGLFIFLNLLLKLVILFIVSDVVIDFFTLIYQVAISSIFYVVFHKIFDDFYKKYFC